MNERAPRSGKAKTEAGPDAEQVRVLGEVHKKLLFRQVTGGLDAAAGRKKEVRELNHQAPESEEPDA